ncbi:Papain-like cysteine protease c1 [Globisporangium polare]
MGSRTGSSRTSGTPTGATTATRASSTVPAANTDRTGGDVGSVSSSTAVNCCGICRSTTRCYTFAWTDYNGGTCWRKDASSQETPATGVTSGEIFWR